MATSPITANALPLNHVFAPRAPAKAPARKAGHSVEVLDPAPPRRPGRLERAAKRFGHKIGLLVAGAGLRADAQHRQHLKRANEAMGRLASTLVWDPANQQQINRALHDLARAARGLDKGLGLGLKATLSRLFTARATVQLERLPDDQLKALSEHLAHWARPQQAAVLPPKLANSLRQLKRLTHKEATRRAMFLVFRTIVDQRATGPAAGGQRFKAILRFAEALRVKLKDNGTAPGTRQLCLAKELLAQCVSNGCLSLDDAHQLMDSLPPQLLREWLAAQQAPEFHDAQPMDDLIQAHIPWQEERQRGTASDEAHQAFQLQLQPIQDDQPQSHVERNGGDYATGVSESTWKDFGRATHTFLDKNGHVSMHMEPSRFPREEADRLQVRKDMVDRLFAMTDHEPMAAERVARCLNQRGIPAAFEYVMFSEHSPVRLPDGRTGKVVPYRSPESGETYSRTHYTARPGPVPGQFLVHVEYRLDKLSLFMDPLSAESVALDHDRSHAVFSADIVIEADGRIHAPTPFKVDYQLFEKRPGPSTV